MVLYGDYMTRPCYVCTSPNKHIYEELKLKDKRTIKYIAQYAEATLSERISYDSFQRHFKNHLHSVIEAHEKADKLRNEVIERNIRKDIQLAEKLSNNLELVSTLIAEMLDKKKIEGELSLQDYNLLLKYIDVTDRLANTFMKWSDKLKLVAQTDKLFDKIVHCMHDFPPDLIELFEKRWLKYEPSS